MPSNEIKRQFTLGKMEKDKDDRLVEPGAYRDALNIDVSRSEGDDSGALQVVRGNLQPVNQDIDWSTRRVEADPDQVVEEFTELIKPFGETVGVYAYPQEEKIYFFNTGRPVDPDNPDVMQPLQNAIFEYDQVANVVSPIIIETDTGDYEAGGSATQEFIGELGATQIWNKASYQEDTNVGDNAFRFTKIVSTDTDNDFATFTLTCQSQTVIDRDSDDNPIYHTDGDFCAAVCTDPTQDDCNEAALLYEASNGELVCRVGGVANTGDICECSNVGTDNCDYAQYQSSQCPVTGGLTRTEEDCRSTAGVINDDLNYEVKANLVIEYDGAEWPATQWTYDPDPMTDIQYQVITQNDLDNTGCTPNPSAPNPIGQTKYTLNGNGAELQPEEFCDPRCDIFNPYPEYCLETPILNSLYDVQLTDASVEHNRDRIVVMTDVPNVGEGEQITVTMKRLIPDTGDLSPVFDTELERYNWADTSPTDDGRGIFTAENAVIIRDMDALDFQQWDQIFGNVGLASRPVGYTYRVARNGYASWVPNSDDPFQAIPDNNTDTEAILANLNPLDSAIPAGGELNQELDFNVEVDRDQEYEINADDESDDVHDPNSDQYLDDLTRDE